MGIEGVDVGGVGRVGVGTEQVSGVGTGGRTKEGTGSAGEGWAGIGSKEFRWSDGGAGPDEGGEGIGTSADSVGAIGSDELDSTLMAESDCFSGSALKGLGMLLINDLGLSCFTSWAGPVRPGNGTTSGRGVVGVATSLFSKSPGT